MKMKMIDKILKDYFENTISSDSLSEKLNDCTKKQSYDTSQTTASEMESDTLFEIEAQHINFILTETLEGKLTFEDLNKIASGLMFSDFFNWDSETEIGERIAQIIFELENPEICFPITNRNLIGWKAYLETGNHRLKKSKTL